MKTLYIKDLVIGQKLSGEFQVVLAEERKTGSGKPYLSLCLRDKTGEVKGNKWDMRPTDMAQCSLGSIVHIKGKAENYNGSTQLNIEFVMSVAAMHIEVADEDFIPVSAKPYDELVEDVKRLMDAIEDPWLNKLVRTILSSKDGYMWRNWPAAKSVHHAVKHGLMQHSVEVAQYAEALCMVRDSHGYNDKINRSLVIAGALLHDIGKVGEYVETQNGAFDIGVGGLHGHIVIGVQMITKTAFEIGMGFDETYDELIHIICAHHQELEHGSPVKPMTPAALIVAKADQLSSDMYNIWNARDKHTGQGVYAKTMHGYVYCPKE